MKTMLYGAVAFLADIHERLLSINDAYEYYYSDKQLHFLVIGITGMLLLFIVHPIFNALAKHGHTLVISWLYVFTVILVLTFAIEIGQGVTHTGHMDFSDIVSGVVGFLLMFLVFAILRALVLFVISLFKK